MATIRSKKKEHSLRNFDNINKRSDKSISRAVKRTMSSSSPPSPVLDATFETLRKEINEATVQHSETIYWLQLELKTTQQAKAAVEDRMAELYRDVQELQDSMNLHKNEESKSSKGSSSSSEGQSRRFGSNATFAAQQKQQLEKYERMLRIMNHQIKLVQTSSDSLVKSLKDEISELMDEKVRTELDLMNKLTAVESEKRELEQKVSQITRFQSERGNGEILNQQPSSPNRGEKNQPPQPPRRHKSIDHDDNNETNNLLREDIKRLRVENESLKQQQISKSGGETEVQALREVIQQLTSENQRRESDLTVERIKSRQRLVQWTKEKASLEDDLESVRSKRELSEERIQWIQENRDVATASLDRVALLWDRADDCVHILEESKMEILRCSNNRSHHHMDTERLLSVQETALLLHGQIKVSLMLIELKLRNGLSCLENDPTAEHGLAMSDDLRTQLQAIQLEAMNEIGKVEAHVNEQIENLRSQSIEESTMLREMHQAEVVDLRQMLQRQEHLEEELNQLQSSRGMVEQSNSVNVLVTPEALEALQKEVIQVVERVKEKNETIGRLTAEIEEHKVRERTLMEELKRHMRDQADRQLLDQQRIMQQNAQFRRSGDDDSAEESSEYEEKTVDGTIYEETTVYEEETVM